MFKKDGSKSGKKNFRKKPNKLVIQSIPYLITAYAVNKLFWLYRNVPGKTPLLKIMNALQNVKVAFANPVPSFYMKDLGAGLIGGIVLWLLVRYKKANAKKFRIGEEYGSARWGTKSEIEPYMDKDFRNNIIFTKTEGLRLNGKPRNVRYERNKNAMIIGTAGSGKTRFFIKPQLMQMNCSYVVTDPNGYNLVG